MRRLLTGMLLAGVLAMSSGCQVVGQPGGWKFKPVNWHLHNGTYRPFNDVNSGSLPPVFWDICGPTSYEDTIEHGQLMRY